MSSKKLAILEKHDDDVVIVTAVRSAITKVRHLSIRFTLAEKFRRAERVDSRTLNRNLSYLMSFVQLIQKPILIPNSLKISLSEMFFLPVEALALLAWQLFMQEFPLKPRLIPSTDSAHQDCPPSIRLPTRSE